MVDNHNKSSTGRRPLIEPRDVPLGGHCGETTEIEGREPTINILPHLSQSQNGMHQNEPFPAWGA